VCCGVIAVEQDDKLIEPDSSMSITQITSHLTRYGIGFAPHVHNNEVIAVGMHLYKMHSYIAGLFLNVGTIVNDRTTYVERPFLAESGPCNGEGAS
jgi:hypothetical protein